MDHRLAANHLNNCMTPKYFLFYIPSKKSGILFGLMDFYDYMTLLMSGQEGVRKKPQGASQGQA